VKNGGAIRFHGVVIRAMTRETLVSSTVAPTITAFHNEETKKYYILTRQLTKYFSNPSQSTPTRQHKTSDYFVMSTD
jgi:hypothetical protein